MTKYIVTVSYVCESKSEIGAILALNHSLTELNEKEFNKFTPIKVEEAN